MPESVTVKQGDCIASMAYERGFFPDTVWNHADNRDLKVLRKNPNVLFPGDVVHIPDKELAELDATTEKRHRYRRKGVPEILRVRFLVEGKPRQSKPVRIEMDGKLTTGTTDDDGWLEVPIPPNAQVAKIVFESGKEYTLELGGMDPVTETAGVQKRLENIGMYAGPIDGEPSAELSRVIAAFQHANGLDATGEMDDQTRSRLEEAAG